MTLRRHSARSSVVLASPGSKSSPQRQQTRDANHSNSNKAADHGERIFVDFQHTAPHREIASDQPDCRRLGSKFLWLRCNDPIFYCGKKMAETRVIRTDDLRNRSWKPGSPRRHPTRWTFLRAKSRTTFRLINRRKLNWSSTSKQPCRSGSTCRTRCSPALTG